MDRPGQGRYPRHRAAHRHPDSQDPGRYVLSGEGATKQLKGITPPLMRLRAQNHRIFFHDHGDELKIERVLDRKEAYR